TQTDLAGRMGRPIKTINEIIKGKASITPDTAIQLENVLGIPARFWLERDRHYQEFLARRRSREELDSQKEWLKRLPVSSMVKLGWMPRHADPADQVKAALEFFGVASPTAWESVWLQRNAAARKSAAFNADPGAFAAWLRRGELEGRAIECAAYGRKKFRQALRAIRGLTRETPEVFLPELQRLCADAGVAAVFVPELPGCRASGGTQWVGASKAVIQLSARYKTNDQLWFTFFHEAGHVLFHSKKAIFVDDGQISDELEAEADQFSADLLIPPQRYTEFLSQRGRISSSRVQRFADDLGIAPGIVVGRLQHDGVISFDMLNGLKDRFELIQADCRNQFLPNPRPLSEP
ncbi:MAG: ImmA/IrrE family metallo-endopeptidase, partial [Firmicutes bacterium]|nr:ImmA/IrrE family metallo-endopeptidase [Bacillota bacterium]